MTTNKKLPLFLIISGIIAIAGLVVFFLFGFNLSDTVTDKKTIAITYDSYITIDDSLGEELEELCVDIAEENSLDVLYVSNSVMTGGGTLELAFAPDTSSDLLESAKDSMLTALASSGELANSTYEGAVHTVVALSFYTYVWRGAIAACACVVFAFAYVAIRYRLHAGVTVAIVAVHDLALVVALTLICRIPVTTSFVAACAFALVYSVLNALFVFFERRKCEKSEAIKAMTAEEAESYKARSAGKLSCLIATLSLAALVILGAASLFVATGFLWFVLPAVIAVLVTSYSSRLLLPALYAPMQAAADERARQKEKYDYQPAKKKKKAADDAGSTSVDSETDID